MGGLGSGNRWDSKSTTESQHRIDIRWLKKQGCLQPGTMDLLSWSCGDKKDGTICYMMEADCMVLIYSYRPHGGDWEPVEQTISFDRTPCNYGGFRTWFLCPQCRRRVAVLYEAGKYFLCRHCYDLTYASQQENRADRLMRKARKIRERLGASNNLIEPILSKPKNMHQKTFDRLRKEEKHTNDLSLVIAGQRLGLGIV